MAESLSSSVSITPFPCPKQISPSPSPSPTKYAIKVLYPYDAQLPDELTIRPGDVITVEAGHNEEDSLWWMGTDKDGCNGFFYVIFAEQLNESDEEENIQFLSSATLVDMYSVSFEEISYFVEDRPGDELECIICKNLADDPHQSKCCGHTMCYNCAHKWLKRNNSCPQCRGSPLEIVVDTRTKRHISSLTVCCTHYKSGCEWKVSFNTVRDHLSEDCLYEDVECRNDECTEKFQRGYLTEHMDRECSMRNVECPCCEDDLPYHELVNTHYKECPDWPMRCPNHCSTESGKDLTRSTLQDHLENNCPEQVISCQFAEAGCTVRLKRKNMADHIQQSVREHMTAMMSNYMKLKKDHIELQADHRDLKEELDVLKDNHHSLMKELTELLADHMHGDLTEELDVLKDDHHSLVIDHDALKKDHSALNKDLSVLRKDHAALANHFGALVTDYDKLTKDYCPWNRDQWGDIAVQGPRNVRSHW